MKGLLTELISQLKLERNDRVAPEYSFSCWRTVPANNKYWKAIRLYAFITVSGWLKVEIGVVSDTVKQVANERVVNIVSASLNRKQWPHISAFRLLRV
ncbi:hypothetical protein NPIL_321221 [Nephila pilipes]|uniref:Uncharacterized protein n=1 Tax=Nephila pilipes TaxID=299642 RepID=A0A8X6TG80_NEPPI|nr:hypothetical protein NPIL_321221 [Nephila pilipes]